MGTARGCGRSLSVCGFPLSAGGGTAAAVGTAFPDLCAADPPAGSPAVDKAAAGSLIFTEVVDEKADFWMYADALRRCLRDRLGHRPDTAGGAGRVFLPMEPVVLPGRLPGPVLLRIGVGRGSSGAAVAGTGRPPITHETLIEKTLRDDAMAHPGGFLLFLTGNLSVRAGLFRPGRWWSRRGRGS